MKIKVSYKTKCIGKSVNGPDLKKMEVCGMLTITFFHKNCKVLRYSLGIKKYSCNYQHGKYRIFITPV